MENKKDEPDLSISLIEDSSSFKEKLNMDDHLENEDIIEEDENQENSNLEMECQIEVNKNEKKNKVKKREEKNKVKKREEKNTEMGNIKIKEIDEDDEKKSDIIQIRKNKYIKRKKKIIIW
jgi:hypothetical protein